MVSTTKQEDSVSNRNGRRDTSKVGKFYVPRGDGWACYRPVWEGNRKPHALSSDAKKAMTKGGSLSVRRVDLHTSPALIIQDV